eukprot:TRINITY_DN6441_c0_g1_i5.p1 TRINITY_DN6441_c0_g1~~TRINITY_DN6441_c0_g1_i5.p1  ORF type:complete len:113 (+),score=6.50 TRINITY_DN6441_c0_g1_i5:170-508(+)
MNSNNNNNNNTNNCSHTCCFLFQLLHPFEYNHPLLTIINVMRGMDRMILFTLFFFSLLPVSPELFLRENCGCGRAGEGKNKSFLPLTSSSLPLFLLFSPRSFLCRFEVGRVQ